MKRKCKTVQGGPQGFVPELPSLQRGRQRGGELSIEQIALAIMALAIIAVALAYGSKVFKDISRII